MIVVSEHAAKQWLARTDAPDVFPITAWEQGVPIECDALSGDEFRYHDASDTILIRRNETIVTVIDPATAAADRVREAVAAVGGEWR